MKKAESGNTVKVHYTGTLDDGSVFDSSREREPLEFILGAGQLIKDFEEAVLGMAVGESKNVHVPAERAYGLHNPDMLIEISREHFPADMELQVGLPLCMQRNDGQALNVIVAAVTDAVVTVDANHPLAGQALNFVIEVVEVA